MARTIIPRTNIIRGFYATQGLQAAPVKSDLPTETLEHSERILLLEDEEQTNLILKEYLQSLGYQVIAVTNGVEGLKEVMKSDFELIICDMMMPRLPGDMFYLAVQKTRPQLCNRFVFITGHEENATVDAFIAQTHSAILVKPFRLHQLEATLENVLSRFPRKIQAAPALRIIPNTDDVRKNDDVVIEKHRQSFAEVPPQSKKEAVPSIVLKALRIVGFMRNNSKVVPPPLQSVPPPSLSEASPAKGPGPIQDQPRRTRKIPIPAISSVEPAATVAGPIQDQPRRTRKIPHPAINREALPEVPVTPAAPATQGDQPRITRKTAPHLLVRLPSTGQTPKTTRTVPGSGKKSVTIRVKNRETPPAPASTARLTRKTAARESAAASSTRKVTRTIPKTTRKIAASENTVTLPAQKVTRTIPKTTRKIAAPVTLKVLKQDGPKVTRRVSSTSK